MKKKGLLALIVALIAVFSVAMAGCSKAPTITLNKSEITLDVGAKETLVATVVGATEDAVTWKSSNTAAATVSATGEVTARGGGESTITVTLNENPDVTATCTVTVNVVPVTSVTIVDPTSTTMVLGAGTLDLDATVAPDDATDKRLDWTSSDDAKAEVDVNGVVTAKAPGSVTITAKSKANADKKDEIELTIVRPEVTSVTGAPASLTLPMNTSRQFTATVGPTHSDQAVTWAITSQAPDLGYEDVVEETAPGLFKAVGSGSAKVQATSVAKPTVKSLELTISVSPVGTKSMVAISTLEDFKQIYSDPNADYYLTGDVDFGGAVLSGAQSFMLVDAAVAVDTDNGNAITFTAPTVLADRFVDGNKAPVKHFIDRGTQAYDYEVDAPTENGRLFGPYDPASADPMVSSRYLVLSADGTEYEPIAQHDLFKNAVGDIEKPGSGAGAVLREPFAAYKRVMTGLGNPLGTSGDSRVFHLRGDVNFVDVFDDGIKRYYQAPVVTFNGVFDGRGYTISNFEMQRPPAGERLSLGSAQWGTGGVTDAWGQSLFGNIGLRGIVRNLAISNVTFNVQGQGGIISAQNNGLIENINISDVKSFKDFDNANGVNCASGFLMGINNPTGRIQNIVFDGTGAEGLSGTAAQIGNSTNGAQTVFPIAVANRAGKTAAATQIKNIFIEKTRFTATSFISTDNPSDNPAATVEAGGYTPTGTDNNAHFFAAGDIGEVDFAALDPIIWDLTGDGFPTLRKQTAAPCKVNFTDEHTDGSLGFVAYGSPLAATGVSYEFTLNLLRTHQVAANLTVNYTIVGGVAEQNINGVASAPLSDGSVDYTFTIPGTNMTGPVLFNSITGVTERATRNVTNATSLGDGVFLTNADGITVATLPAAVEGQSYTFGLYTELDGDKAANPTLDYVVAGGNSDTLAGGYSTLKSGGFTYWFFTVPAADVTGAITFSNLDFTVKYLLPISFNGDAIDQDGTSSWGTGVTPPGITQFVEGDPSAIEFSIWVGEGQYMAGDTAGKSFSVSITVNGIEFDLNPISEPHPDERGGGAYVWVITVEMLNEALAEDATKLEIVCVRLNVIDSNPALHE